MSCFFYLQSLESWCGLAEENVCYTAAGNPPGIVLVWGGGGGGGGVVGQKWRALSLSWAAGSTTAGNRYRGNGDFSQHSEC